MAAKSYVYKVVAGFFIIWFLNTGCKHPLCVSTYQLSITGLDICTYFDIIAGWNYGRQVCNQIWQTSLGSSGEHQVGSLFHGCFVDEPTTSRGLSGNTWHPRYTPLSPVHPLAILNPVKVLPLYPKPLAASLMQF